jgi:hypothetical protein
MTGTDFAVIVALVVAIPFALAITRIVMALAARANRKAARWDYYCGE